MTRRDDHVNTLIFDIRDCAKRAHELGWFQRAETLSKVASDMEQMSSQPASRDSIPPGSDKSNSSIRATATQHFKEARKLLAGILK